MNITPHIDHIDPSWAEGRDYQLVCGLDVVYNMCERDPILNMSKANRFLPWRTCPDEIGTVPVEQGDLCLFLDPDTDEWALEEFLGTWWFEKSKAVTPQANMVWTDEMKSKISTANTGRKRSPEARAKIAAASRKRRGWNHTSEAKAKLSAAQRGRKATPETKAKLSAASARRRGWNHTDETRAKLAEAGKKRKHSPETKAKMAASQSRRQARERCRRMSFSDPQMPNFED
jgi:hypothetical protein